MPMGMPLELEPRRNDPVNPEFRCSFAYERHNPIEFLYGKADIQIVPVESGGLSTPACEEDVLWRHDEQYKTIERYNVHKTEIHRLPVERAHPNKTPAAPHINWKGDTNWTYLDHNAWPKLSVGCRTEYGNPVGNQQPTKGDGLWTEMFRKDVLWVRDEPGEDWRVYGGKRYGREMQACDSSGGSALLLACEAMERIDFLGQKLVQTIESAQAGSSTDDESERIVSSMVSGVMACTQRRHQELSKNLDDRLLSINEQLVHLDECTRGLREENQINMAAWDSGKTSWDIVMEEMRNKVRVLENMVFNSMEGDEDEPWWRKWTHVKLTTMDDALISLVGLPEETRARFDKLEVWLEKESREMDARIKETLRRLEGLEEAGALEKIETLEGREESNHVHILQLQDQMERWVGEPTQSLQTTEGQLMVLQTSVANNRGLVARCQVDIEKLKNKDSYQ